MPFLTFFSGSFAVQYGDHLCSGIICGPGIIFGAIWGSFVVLGSFAGPYRSFTFRLSFEFHGPPLLTLKTDRLDLRGLDPGKK